MSPILTIFSWFYFFIFYRGHIATGGKEMVAQTQKIENIQVGPPKLNIFSNIKEYRP
jgi:hypothetical protein